MTTIRIEAENPRRLIPHEDILVEKMLNISLELGKSKLIKPVIVDSNTHVILDGHHRHAAALRLSFNKIPVFYVDYESPRIYIDIWYRRFSNPSIAKVVLSSFKSDGIVCAKFDFTRICDKTLFKVYWKLEMIEKVLSSIKINVEKDTYGHLEPPPIDKETVIDIANKGLRFPPKTTRHVYKFIIPQDAVSIDDI